MSTTNAHASSSKPAGKGKEHVKGGGKGKGPGKGRKDQPRMKSNLIKRQQGDEELKDLQARIDAFVGLARMRKIRLMIRYRPILWRHSPNYRYRSVHSKVSPYSSTDSGTKLTARPEVITLPQTNTDSDLINTRLTSNPRRPGLSKNRIRQNTSFPDPTTGTTLPPQMGSNGRARRGRYLTNERTCGPDI